MASDGGSGKASGFSLSLGASKARKVDVQEGARTGPVREEVLGFGADGGLKTSAAPAAQRGPLVITRQENSYKVGAKFRPSFVPEASDVIDASEDKFETAAHDTITAQQSDVTYGLLLRARPQDGAQAPAQQQQQQQRDEGGAAPGTDRDAAKLKEDLADLPPESDLEAYAAMPVDQFGMALLRGMGWSEGRALGRASKEEVQAKELVRRPQRLGLGAAPAPEQQQQKKYIKPGETRDQRDLVYVDPQTGATKASKPVGEALVERRKEGVHPGKVMRVVEGRHSGLLCEVTALEPRQEGRSERARVRLLPSYETVTVRCSELGEREAEERGGRSQREEDDERRRKQQQQEGRRREDGSRPSSRGGSEREGGGGGKRPREQHAPEQQQQPGSSSATERPWLAANIRVKIVDKRVRGGRLYLKKGTVVDVKAPTVCDVFVDDLKESILDLRQAQLETVVPAAEGTPVLVLAGALRGKRGRLLARNTDTGLAAVQLSADMSVHKLPLDDISQYAGSADEDDE